MQNYGKFQMPHIFHNIVIFSIRFQHDYEAIFNNLSNRDSSFALETSESENLQHKKEEWWRHSSFLKITFNEFIPIDIPKNRPPYHNSHCIFLFFLVEQKQHIFHYSFWEETLLNLPIHPIVYSFLLLYDL